ncbi:MAG: DinB family protein [Chloroflexota bacterium]|nr:DinB family protein [Chloroflexota bacterium]
MMDLKKAIAQLHQQGVSIRSLVADMTEETARWKPDPDSWSILEVLNHLVDEEVFDFRRHSEHMLFTPDQPWPEIDPQGWIKERTYNQRKLNETLRNFERERANSITWLGELTEPNWDSKVTFSWGALTAGDMLASWLAHDLLHIRQLVELRYQLTAANSIPFRVEYAGKW